MAFNCIKNDKQIYSFVYSLKDWIALKEDKTSSFNMACCGNQAILKTSKLGTQFFAHKSKPETNDCSNGGETPEHIHIKYLVSKKLFECGWSVEVEKRGVSNKGEEWIADIYAEKGKAKIAIEVQWSRQSFIETKRRQQVYKDSGIRCAWLLRSGSIKDRDAIVGDFMHRTKSVPVFSIYKNKNESDSTYQVYNICKVALEEELRLDPLDQTELELESFVENLVSGNIQFRPKYSPTSQLSLDIVRLQCWSCKKPTNTVMKVRFKNTLYDIDHEYSHNSQDVDVCDKETIDRINSSFSQSYNFSPLRSRYSDTVGSSYIANSCIHCDALMGRHFLKSWGSYYSNKIVKTSEIIVPRNGRMLMEFGAVSFYNRMVDYDIGRWVFIDTLSQFEK